ncbi:MAG: hypothetical protein JRG94_09730 [Deltaproteobacteria bacterium]|nr:hypothetical protein [Deltaproteobacteria bacterium]
MPIYEYQCEKCQHEFEREQRITADPIKTCPKCAPGQEADLSNVVRTQGRRLVQRPLLEFEKRRPGQLDGREVGSQVRRQEIRWRLEVGQVEEVGG